MKITPEIIAGLCRQCGPELLTPVEWVGSPFDKVKLCWGFAGVESSFGWNCTPRHEQGYCYGGHHYDVGLSRDWGCLAHCSYGPWQVMFSNFPLGVSPLSLLWSDDGRIAAGISLRGAIRVLNRAIATGARSLADIVVAYNGPGNEEQYSARLVDCLLHPMPESPATVTA